MVLYQHCSLPFILVIKIYVSSPAAFQMLTGKRGSKVQRCFPRYFSSLRPRKSSASALTPRPILYRSKRSVFLPSASLGSMPLPMALGPQSEMSVLAQPRNMLRFPRVAIFLTYIRMFSILACLLLLCLDCFQAGHKF